MLIGTLSYEEETQGLKASQEEEEESHKDIEMAGRFDDLTAESKTSKIEESLGTTKQLWPTYVGRYLNHNARRNIIELLKEYVNVAHRSTN